MPKFVFRWIKATSATGYLRFTNSINRREQDGPALRMLCSSCEALLQKHEDNVHDCVFSHIVAGKSPIDYDENLLKFGESLLLRSLWFREAMDEDDDDTPEVAEKVSGSTESWRRHLLGELEHPGEYEVHVIPIDHVRPETLTEYSGRINHYFTRSVDMDVLWSEKVVYVMVLIPHMLFLGKVFEAQRVLNLNSRIAATRGVIGDRNKPPLMPRAVWDHLIEKAQFIEEALGKQSEVQKAKIAESYARNPKRAYHSLTHEAGKADWFSSFILKKPN